MAVTPNLSNILTTARQVSQLPAAQTPQQSALDKALGVIGSPGGAALIGAAGAGISAYGANKSAEANRAQSAQQFAAEMAQRQLESGQADQRARAAATVDASPLGAEQQFAQRNAILNSILGNAQNFSVRPGDSAIGAAMGPGPQGGLRLPNGGLDKGMLDRLYGDEATMASIQNRAKTIGQLNPHAPVMEMDSLFGDKAEHRMNDITASNQSEMERQFAEQQHQREIIARAIDEDIRGEKQPQKSGGGNIFGKILKGIGTGASFIPGVGQVVAPIATGLGGLVNGDGLKSSLINAGISAIPGLAGAGKLGGAAKNIATNPIGRAIMGGR